MSCFGVGSDKLHKVLDALDLIPPKYRELMKEALSSNYLLLNKYLTVSADCGPLLMDQHSIPLDESTSDDDIIPALEGHCAYVYGILITFGAGTTEVGLASNSRDLLLSKKEFSLAVPLPAFLFKGDVSKAVGLTVTGGTVSGVLMWFYGRP